MKRILFVGGSILVVTTIAAAVALLPGIVLKRQARELLRNGARIHMQLFWDPVINVRYEWWPKSTAGNRWTSSTKYFHDVITGRWGTNSARLALLSGPGLRTWKGGDPADFHAENNAWCVTLDLPTPPWPSEVPIDERPLFFTRNLKIDSLSDPVDAALSDDAPFGKKAVVVIRTDGLGTVLWGKEEVVAYFKQFSATNRVLRP
jgi:hypothetical protein